MYPPIKLTDLINNNSNKNFQKNKLDLLSSKKFDRTNFLNLEE